MPFRHYFFFRSLTVGVITNDCLIYYRHIEKFVPVSLLGHDKLEKIEVTEIKRDGKGENRNKKVKHTKVRTHVKLGENKLTVNCCFIKLLFYRFISILLNEKLFCKSYFVCVSRSESLTRTPMS